MVGKEEFKRIKLVWDEKYYEAFANAVGCCCLQKKDYPPYHALAKGIHNPKETPRNNHLCDLPPPVSILLFPCPFFFITFSCTHNFLMAIQGLEIGNKIY